MLEQGRKFLAEFPGGQVLLTDGVLEALEQSLECRKENVVVFSGLHYAGLFRQAGYAVWCGVEAEPATGTVEKMIAFLEETVPEKVVAVGGGSVLDAAKAAYLSWQTGWKLADLFGVNRWSSANPGKRLKRLIAIPTTSGTGSEATPYSNIVDRSAGVKKLIVEAESVPDTAICSAKLQASMPPELTRAVGWDALAHLIEGFLNVGADNAHPAANRWALCGIALIKEFLKKAVDEPENQPAREAMMIASTLGGMTIRFKSTGLPHLCSFSWFGRIAHGEAVVLLLPEAWRYYLANPAVAARTMELAGIFPGNSPLEVISSFREFITAAGMPEKLSAWPEITPELLMRTAASGCENRMKLDLAPNPVPLDKSYDILLDIMQKSY